MMDIVERWKPLDAITGATKMTEEKTLIMMMREQINYLKQIVEGLLMEKERLIQDIDRYREDIHYMAADRNMVTRRKLPKPPKGK